MTDRVESLLLRSVDVGYDREFDQCSPTKLDLRIIAATHPDLAAMVKAGLFREDLYYRLMVVPIELSPLRERTDDIPQLVSYFFNRCKLQHAREELRLPTELFYHFGIYSWPGNVRQLENAIEGIVLLASGSEITLYDLPDYLRVRLLPSEVLPAILPENGLISMRWKKSFGFERCENLREIDRVLRFPPTEPPDADL